MSCRVFSRSQHSRSLLSKDQKSPQPSMAMNYCSCRPQRHVDWILCISNSEGVPHQQASHPSMMHIGLKYWSMWMISSSMVWITPAHSSHISFLFSWRLDAAAIAAADRWRIKEKDLLRNLTSHAPKLQQQLHLLPWRRLLGAMSVKSWFQHVPTTLYRPLQRSFGGSVVPRCSKAPLGHRPLEQARDTRKQRGKIPLPQSQVHRGSSLCTKTSQKCSKPIVNYIVHGVDTLFCWGPCPKRSMLINRF